MYDLNARPSADPIKFPVTVNTSDFYKQDPSQAWPKQQNSLPAQYVNQQSAKAYSYDLQLAADKEVLQRAQQYQPSVYTQGIPAVSRMSQQQPLYRDVYHEEKAVRVVVKDDIETPWKCNKNFFVYLYFHQVKCMQLEKQVYDLQQENNKYRGMNITTEKVTYYEDTGRVNNLVSEVDRLNKTLLDLNKEIETWRNRYVSLEAQLKARANVEVELDRMRRVVQDSENVMQVEMNRLREQLEEWQRRYKNLEGSLSEARLIEVKARDVEQQMLAMHSEIKKLQISLKAKSEDYDALQQKYGRLERVIRESEYQSNEVFNLRKIIDDRNKEIEQIKSQSNNIRDYESKLALLSVELDRLNAIIASKEEEINHYKSQLNRLSNYENQSRLGEVEQERSQYQVKSLNDETKQLRQKCKQLIEDQQIQDESIKFLTNEVEVWKRKFLDLNKEYHNQQEELILTQAQLKAKVK